MSWPRLVAAGCDEDGCGRQRRRPLQRGALPKRRRHLRTSTRHHVKGNQVRCTAVAEPVTPALHEQRQCGGVIQHLISKFRSGRIEKQQADIPMH